MTTLEDHAKRPREQRLQHLTRTADDLSAAVKGQSEPALARRPDGESWAAKEVVCHLRDTEEVFGARMQQILAMDVFGKLTRAEWEKGAVHPTLGRIALDQLLSIMAWHDENHLDQLARALQGRA